MPRAKRYLLEVGHYQVRGWATSVADQDQWVPDRTEEIEGLAEANDRLETQAAAWRQEGYTVSGDAPRSAFFLAYREDNHVGLYAGLREPIPGPGMEGV